MIGVVVSLTVAGVGYAGLMIWRDNGEIEDQDGKVRIDEPSLQPSKVWFQEEVPDLDASDWTIYRNKRKVGEKFEDILIMTDND